MKELAQFKNLRLLDVRRTGVTDAGIKELRAALPDLVIGR
jgi:hypothetical protein